MIPHPFLLQIFRGGFWSYVSWRTISHQERMFYLTKKGLQSGCHVAKLYTSKKNIIEVQKFRNRNVFRVRGGVLSNFDFFAPAFSGFDSY